MSRREAEIPVAERDARWPACIGETTGGRTGRGAGSRQIIARTHNNMAKLKFPILFGVFLLAVALGNVPAQAASIVPEISASRIITLAPASQEEKPPVISCLAIDPAGKLLAAGGDDHHVRVLDVATGEVKRRLKAHTDWVKASAFRPDGAELGHRRRRSADSLVGHGGHRPAADIFRSRCTPSTTLVYQPRRPDVGRGGLWREGVGFRQPRRPHAAPVGRAGRRTSARFASRPTARDWPPPAVRDGCESGTRQPAGRPTTCRSPRGGFVPWPTRRTGKLWPRPGSTGPCACLDAGSEESRSELARAAGRSLLAVLLRPQHAGLGRQRQRDPSLGHWPPGKSGAAWSATPARSPRWFSTSTRKTLCPAVLTRPFGFGI